MSHLRKSKIIHAPLEKVYSLAHDPHHWDDWYVGFSEEKEVTDKGPHRYLTVGMAFPLTQRVEEDHLDPDGACWRTRVEGPPLSAEETYRGALLMLAGDNNWTFKRANGDTEVTIDVEFSVPEFVLDRHVEPPVVESLEAQCLERSLENLRMLCEKAV